jgi:2-dehydropantoate 2-reductase
MSVAEIGRIAVVGAGAIGGWAATKLAIAGHDVHVLARGETLQRIGDEGLLLTEGGETFTARVRVSAEAQGIADVLIIAVKAPALADAAEAARPMVGPGTIILPMLNGVPWWFIDAEPLRSIDPQGRIAAALPADQLVGCVVHAACSRSAPNHVVVKHAERLILGDPGGGASERVGRLCAVFAASGIAADPSDSIRHAIWYKLWGNATINPVSALTRATADRLLADRPTRQLMLEAMAELATIGAAIGCPIEQSGEERMDVTARLGAFKSSMLQDVEAGRRIELEALLGAPIEIARRVGIETPALHRLYGLTRLMAESLGLL